MEIPYVYYLMEISGEFPNNPKEILTAWPVASHRKLWNRPYMPNSDYTEDATESKPVN